MIRPPAASAVRCDPIGLVREDWRGRATLAWVPAACYPELAARHRDLLGPREQDAFDALEHERRRTSYLLGRHAAKTALAPLVDLADPRAIDIVPGCFQQPVVLAPIAATVGVSISHARTGACAVAFPEGHPMGIDVEEIDPARVETMKTQFVDREIEAIGRLGDEALLSAVVWTAKEALSKVLRCGMTAPFEFLEVSAMVFGDAVASGQFQHFGQYRFQSWIRGGIVVSLVLPRRTHLDLQPQFLGI